MKISKNSWHYKLLKKSYYFESNIPTSLCAYFWYVVFEVVKRIGATLMFTFMITLLVITCFLGGEMFSAIFGWFKGYSIFIPNSYAFIPLVTTFVLGFLILTIMCAAPAIIGFVSFKYDVWKMSRKEEKKESNKMTGKEPNLLVSYLKAKKQKVCPMITFTEEKE